MHIIEHPCVPFATPIYGGMNHDAKIEIHGEPVHGHHGGFTIELLSMEGIALHMDVRMGKHGEHTIVLNNCRHGHWGCEERHHNVFHCGHHFHMKIKNHHHHYAIHVNGCHVATFHHREDPHHIRALEIKGDVRVSKIHFEHFHHHNGGGIQVGSAPVVGFGVAPAPVVVAAPPPVMVAPAPIVVAPAPAPVVVVEEGHHHHHRGGALLAGAVIGATAGALLGGHRHHHHHHHH